MAWKKMKLRLILLLVSVVSLFRSTSSSVPKDPFLGISPQDEKFYSWSSETIKCRDGSKKFTKSQLNDEFCDCPDGTDEPGTSACPNGKFYCRNAGHVPQTLFSSRVNDGICDCCDGSDEYSVQVVCKNTCWEAGKVARDKLKKKITTYEEGVALRKQEIEKAKVAFSKDEEELARLKKEEKVLKGLVQQLKERKELIEKAEEKERLQKEKEEKETKEAEDALQGKATGQEEAHVDNPADGEDHTRNADDEIISTLEDSHEDESLISFRKEIRPPVAETSITLKNEISSMDSVEVAENKEEPLLENGKDDTAVLPETGHDSGREATTGRDTETEAASGEAKKGGGGESENTKGLSKEELGRLVASRWTGENGKEKSREGDTDEVHGETVDQTYDEDDGYAPDSDDEAENYDSGKYSDDLEDELDETYDDENHEDTSSSYKSDVDDEFTQLDTSNPSSSNPSWLERIQQTVRNMLQAVNLFQTPVNISEAAHIRKEYDESSEKLSKIESRISSLTQKLKHDFGPDKEFYSFYGRCFESKQNKYVYKVCPYKQASQVEGYTTTRLGSWDKFEDSYRAMAFTNGDKCWNGPDRSIKVRLRCGLQNEIADVDEPSRCEYVAVLSTPAICHEQKLKELQDKLDSLDQELPKHDEL